MSNSTSRISILDGDKHIHTIPTRMSAMNALSGPRGQAVLAGIARAVGLETDANDDGSLLVGWGLGQPTTREVRKKVWEKQHTLTLMGCRRDGDQASYVGTDTRNLRLVCVCDYN